MRMAGQIRLSANVPQSEPMVTEAVCVRDVKGVASIRDPPIDEGQGCGGLAICSPRRECSGLFPLPRLRAWGSWGGSYWTSRVSARSG